MGVAGFLLAFGFLSRRFERQADVFAARTVQKNVQASEADHVGEHGARVYDHECAVVLRAIESGARGAVTVDSTGYLDLLTRLLQASGAGQTPSPPAREPESPLILP